MVLRTAAAVAAAIVLGWWCVSRSRRPETTALAPRSRLGVALHGVLLAMCAFWALAWLTLAAMRLRYPFELEWCGGPMREMAMRALHGENLYPPPGPGWFPYEYPPLYAWLCAIGMRFAGVSYVPMRLVSIASTLVSAYLLFSWVRRVLANRGPRAAYRLPDAESRTPNAEAQPPNAAHGAPNTDHAPKSTIVWSIAAAGLFLAAYRFTGAWYDVERIDMLFLCLSLLGLYWLQVAEDSQSGVWAAAAGVALALAFLAKQQAVLFTAGAIAALAWRREWRLLATFSGVAGALSAGAVVGLNSATHGWFGYYCFLVPLANGVQWHLARTFVVADLPLFAPALALIGVAQASRMQIGDEPAGPAQPGGGLTLLAVSTTMAVIGSLLSRAHWGGDQNVLIPAYALLGALGCACAARLERARPMVAVPMAGLALAQVAVLAYRPGAQLPTADGLSSAHRYVQLVRSLERDGDVLCLDHGGTTRTPHFHVLGLMDVYNREKRIPPAIIAALRTHRYAAIVTDPQPEATGAFAPFRTFYPRVSHVGIDRPWVVTGFLTPAPGRSVWVLRP